MSIKIRGKRRTQSYQSVKRELDNFKEQLENRQLSSVGTRTFELPHILSISKPWPIGLGATHRELPEYPYPSLYQNAEQSNRLEREAELATAKENNWFDASRVNGAVVHGNILSEDVSNNTHWVLRGTQEERNARAQEDDFGVNDTDPGDDGTDIFEAVPEYVAKHLWAFILNPTILLNFADLLNIVVQNFTDNDPDSFKLEIIDPILTLFPQRKAINIEELNFFPDNQQRYPKQAYDSDIFDDDLMGWLQLSPASPYSRLKPYTQHLSNFPVTNTHFRSTPAFANDDLDTAMNEGRVFIVNYGEFHDEFVNSRPTEAYGARLHASIGLFAVPKSGGALKTIAIQSTQDQPADFGEWFWWKFLNIQNPARPLSQILTPNNDYWSWQMAKSTLTTAHSMASVVDHLSTHIYLGPIPIAFYRTIPKQHPLTALLETHFMSLIMNNHIGVFSDVQFPLQDGEYGNGYDGLLTGAIERLSGFTSEAFVESTLRRASEYHFITDSTPIERNQHSEFDAISDFPIHDDNGMYPIIHDWVESYLSLYYANDSDVAEDIELQNFCQETVNEAGVNGFPSQILLFDTLVDTVTRLIYWMSVNHALDRFPSFIKLGSLGYYSDRTPRNDEVKSQQDWLNVCPPLNAGMGLFVFSRIFVDLPNKWHRSLGKYPKGQFMHDPDVYPHLSRFQTRLKNLNTGIEEKNRQRRWGYELMMPSSITVSPWN
ncbi:lipoxygenase family protein [Shewanella nanhaiensis]|uniref:Lipoxygenase domain-containing protein n=1 Tax=Shewanella nanhaiensis TaxID=2864872 RepID=A0ABS7E4U9_9GAMM|nr:lipoxygenase family protein [Shewanella nanhaiensis]MBW8184624.1 hypothetical protein [Shewanella nanhaiensis]